MQRKFINNNINNRFIDISYGILHMFEVQPKISLYKANFILNYVFKIYCKFKFYNANYNITRLLTVQILHINFVF